MEAGVEVRVQVAAEGVLGEVKRSEGLALHEEVVEGVAPPHGLVLGGCGGRGRAWMPGVQSHALHGARAAVASGLGRGDTRGGRGFGVGTRRRPGEPTLTGKALTVRNRERRRAENRLSLRPPGLWSVTLGPGIGVEKAHR